jgi:hypothetical protein
MMKEGSNFIGLLEYPEVIRANGPFIQDPEHVKALSPVRRAPEPSRTER